MNSLKENYLHEKNLIIIALAKEYDLIKKLQAQLDSSQTDIIKYYNWLETIDCHLKRLEKEEVTNE